MFDKVDEDGDGRVGLLEFYDGLMHAYLFANRLGLHIDPPLRATAAFLFNRADADRDGYLTRDEFRAIAPVLEARIGLRVITYASVKFLISPWLAWSAVSALQDKPELIAHLRRAVPRRLAEKAGHLLFSREVWRAAFVVIFMAALSEIAMRLLNAWLASMPFSRVE